MSKTVLVLIFIMLSIRVNSLSVKRKGYHARPAFQTLLPPGPINNEIIGLINNSTMYSTASVIVSANGAVYRLSDSQATLKFNIATGASVSLGPSSGLLDPTISKLTYAIQVPGYRLWFGAAQQTTRNAVNNLFWTNGTSANTILLKSGIFSVYDISDLTYLSDTLRTSVIFLTSGGNCNIMDVETYNWGAIQNDASGNKCNKTIIYPFKTSYQTYPNELFLCKSQVLLFDRSTNPGGRRNLNLPSNTVYTDMLLHLAKDGSVLLFIAQVAAPYIICWNVITDTAFPIPSIPLTNTGVPGFLVMTANTNYEDELLVTFTSGDIWTYNIDTQTWKVIYQQPPFYQVQYTGVLFNWEALFRDELVSQGKPAIVVSTAAGTVSIKYSGDPTWYLVANNQDYSDSTQYPQSMRVLPERISPTSQVVNNTLILGLTKGEVMAVRSPNGRFLRFLDAEPSSTETFHRRRLNLTPGRFLLEPPSLDTTCSFSHLKNSIVNNFAPVIVCQPFYSNGTLIPNLPNMTLLVTGYQTASQSSRFDAHSILYYNTTNDSPDVDEALMLYTALFDYTAYGVTWKWKTTHFVSV